MKIHQPYDGALIREVPVDDGPALDAKLARAAEAFAQRDRWPGKEQRIRVLERLARLIEREAEALALLIAREGGKPLADAKVEVARAVNGVELAAAELARLAGQEIPMGVNRASAGRLAFTTHEPIGVVAAISAFNHPLNLIVHQAAPAIAAGCPVIVKPASTTPLNAIRFVELAHEAGLPEPFCQIAVLEDNALAQRLATDPRVAFLSFIGSARVGWQLRAQLPPGTRCALEHGGVAPLLIDRSAKLDALIEPVVKGGYYHAGQVCVSVQRIYVHESLLGAFLERFEARVRALKVGDPTAADTEVGPLILPREVQRVGEWVEEARRQGARIDVGGRALSERVYAPTVIVEPPEEARVSREEVFGPVTCVYGFRDLDEAIQRANALPLAFQASVFTRDLDSAMHAASRLEASTVMINDHTAFRVDWMPFAGRKRSGYGVGGIPFTLRDMLQEKLIVLSGLAL
jgi:acyl-CoA reductase-like NAD-dependent aldehyde dehydrogenase